MDTVILTIDDAIALCRRAAVAAGANDETAGSLAVSVVMADADGQPSVGMAHFVDYLDALEAGRIDGKVEPEITRPAPAIILSDARGGAAHTAFDRIVDELATTARTLGVAFFTQRNAFTCGSLGQFVARLADKGLVAIAATNGPPIVAGSGSKGPVFCTNPMAFAAPRDDGPPVIVDQSSSATAFVNVRQAAREGRAIPPGWALDADGNETTDPNAAMAGALLPFGGNRGANIALMVEILAAGISGANWSLDAPPFGAGSRGPGTGLFVLALAPARVDAGFGARMAAQITRLADEHGVHVPGAAKAEKRLRSERGGFGVDAAVYQRIATTAARSG